MTHEILSPLFPAISEGLVRQIQTARRARGRFFNDELFADPAWDILLELYAGELAQQRLSGSDVGLAAAVPMSTAWRWINKLEQEGLVNRASDALDPRRHWLSLTPAASSAMQRYFAAISVGSLSV